jgi:hypothetical protein
MSVNGIDPLKARTTTASWSCAIRLNLYMPTGLRLVLIPLLAATAAVSLSGCASTPSTGRNLGDYIPQWAGGLPADAPPRPGTPEYDAFMKEREQRRQMPAADRDKETQPSGSSAASPSTPAHQ